MAEVFIRGGGATYTFRKVLRATDSRARCGYFYFQHLWICSPEYNHNIIFWDSALKECEKYWRKHSVIQSELRTVNSGFVGGVAWRTQQCKVIAHLAVQEPAQEWAQSATHMMSVSQPSVRQPSNTLQIQDSGTQTLGNESYVRIG